MKKINNSTYIIILSCFAIVGLSLSGVVSEQINKQSFSNENVGWSGKEPIKKIDFLKYKEVLSNENKQVTNKEVLEKIGERYSIIQYAENNLNIGVTKAEIINRIKEDKRFYKNDIFSNETYFKQLKEINLTPSEYEKTIRDNILIEKLMKIVEIKNKSLKSSKILSDSMLNALEIDLYKLNYLISNVNKSTKEEIEDFYNKNKKSFKSQDSYNIKLEKFSLSEKDIKTEWEKYKKNPVTIYDIKQILLTNEKEVKEIEKEINKNNFELLAKKYSVDKSSSLEGGLIKGIKENELTPEFKEGLKRIKNGEYFVTKSSIGFHIVKKVKEVSSNIEFNDYYEYFKDDILNNFKKRVVNNTVVPIDSKIEKFSKEDAINLFASKDIMDEKPIILGEGKKYEKLTPISISEGKDLDIKNEEDFKSIENIFYNNKRLEKARNIIPLLDKNYSYEKYPWITKRELRINKNTNLPSELIDALYQTPVGKDEAVKLGNDLYYYKVKNEINIKSKKEDFQKLMDSIYNIESGYILIKEAKLKYPIRISKNII